MASRYKPNFERGLDGNKLRQGKNLIINVDDNPLYIIGQLFKRKSFLRKRLIQIEQTGSRQNPQKDNIVFEMKVNTPNGIMPMVKGKYRVVTYAYFTGKGGKKWGDNFEVI